jgi:hypothetical protein
MVTADAAAPSCGGAAGGRRGTALEAAAPGAAGAPHAAAGARQDGRAPAAQPHQPAPARSAGGSGSPGPAGHGPGPGAGASAPSADGGVTGAERGSNAAVAPERAAAIAGGGSTGFAWQLLGAGPRPAPTAKCRRSCQRAARPPAYAPAIGWLPACRRRMAHGKRDGAPRRAGGALARKQALSRPIRARSKRDRGRADFSMPPAPAPRHPPRAGARRAALPPPAHAARVRARAAPLPLATRAALLGMPALPEQARLGCAHLPSSPPLPGRLARQQVGCTRWPHAPLAPAPDGGAHACRCRQRRGGRPSLPRTSRPAPGWRCRRSALQQLRAALRAAWRACAPRARPAARSAWRTLGHLWRRWPALAEPPTPRSARRLCRDPRAKRMARRPRPAWQRRATGRPRCLACQVTRAPCLTPRRPPACAERCWRVLRAAYRPCCSPDGYAGRPAPAVLRPC